MAAYDTRHGVAFPGMVANTRPKDTISRIIESAAGAGFGVPVFQGSKDNTVTVTPSVKFRGVTIKDITLVHTITSDVDKYIQRENLAAMAKGAIWMTNGALAVVVGDPVYVTPAGALSNVAGGGNVRMGSSTFDTSAAAAGLVRVHVDAEPAA